MSENSHTIEFVPRRPLRDSDRSEILSHACKEWCYDPSSVRYSCPESDTWFEKEVEFSQAVNEIVTHGSGTITGLRRGNVPFTISIGMGSLEDTLTVSTGESTFKSDPATGESERRVDEWIDLARTLYERLDAVLAFSTSEAVDEAGTGEVKFQMKVDDIGERRILDVFWLMIFDSGFADSISLETIRNDPDTEIETLPDENLLVRFAPNPLDFGPERKRRLRDTVLNPN